jgi:ABC-2 type transport system permease protein
MKFEWLFFGRKKSFYAMMVFYLGLGFMAATAARFPFPNTYKNSPYVLNFLLGLMSLVATFSTTILAAQSLFRERDTNFDTILFATPLRKSAYVLSRFSIIFGITLLCYFIFLCGLIAGHAIEAQGNEAYAKFALWNYLQPFLLLLVPNILFCTAVACTIGLVTKNKMLVYVSGILIYFLYWGVSLFTNSPLMAGATPISREAMNWSAKLDPFGVAAFFEQTRHWTAIERNSQFLQLTGNLLVNRTLYLLISALLLALAYRKFSFTIHQSKKVKSESLPQDTNTHATYRAMLTRTTGIFYDLQSIWSLTRIELLNIVKSVPLWILGLGWAGFLVIEIFSTIDGNTRIPERFASTQLMVTSILEAQPIVVLIALLFYGSEVFWRSHQSGFSAFEETTAIKPLVALFSKTLTLIFVIALLIGLSLAIGIGFQVAFNDCEVNGRLYLSLFYLLGLPLTFSAALIVSIQALVKNRYLGIVVAGVIVAITNTSIGGMVGIRHPLLRFANVFQGNYSELNGFGSAVQAFDIKTLYWLCVTSIIFILAAKIWSYKNGTNFFAPKLNWKSPIIFGLSICGFGAIASGYMIYGQTRLPDREALNNWKQAYETQYSRIKDLPQPTVADVKTAIDLFPESESYEVAGEYLLVNKTTSPIDKIYMHGDKEMQWSDWQLENGSLQEQDTTYGHYIFLLDQPLLVGQSTKLRFKFKYSASPFNTPAAFNTIITNGSFIRISNYFPRAGYNSDMEIDDPKERAKRNMPESKRLKSLDEKSSDTFDYGFTHFDAVVSTSGDQTAISVGELTDQWEKDNRSYFHYQSESPIPFRFAVSSARYAVRKISHHNLSIEAYYHPGHHQNIDHLLATAGETLAYCEQQFARYPFKTLRFIEISSFTRGFAGTAYPTSLFINESFGFQNKIDKNRDKDILHEMVSHELAHAWWGNSKIAPDYMEGSKLLTETLAMYTELMMYKATYGEAYLLNRVNVHKDIYLSDRSFADEEPLYKSNPEKPYLAYDKGMVVVYQLYKILGEEKINKALKSFYDKYAFPNRPPVSTDLINEFYLVADKTSHSKIDELFKQIVTYDLKLVAADAAQNPDGSYTVEIDASVLKSLEDGKGKNESLLFTEPIEAAIIFENNKKQVVMLQTAENSVRAQLVFADKPLKVVLDPEGKFLDKSEENNEKNIQLSSGSF